jgi:hypothetical protein
MSAVWRHTSTRLAGRLVLLALADYAHDDGSNAFPSVDSLARKAGVSTRQVQRALRDIEAAGEIERQGTHASGTTIWRITLPGLGVTNRRGDNLSGVTNHAGTGDRMSPKPSLEPSITPYGVFALVCEEAGLDAGAYRKADVSAQCKVAQRLMGDGLTLDEARSVTRYLRGQSWRTDPVTVWTVQKELGKWRAAGRPEREKTARRVTQAEMNRGGTGEAVY